MGTQVVRLGAWCDFVDHVGPGLSFRVAEFAVLADGRHLTLHDERGFDSLGHQSGREAADPWRLLTLEGLERSVLTTVLPDDAEESGDAHPWQWLSGLLRSHGVDVPPEELQLLPYEVVFSERLLKRVSGA